MSLKPWLIHCNTNNALEGRIKDHVIYSTDINTISLFVGQMALSESTRMQATKALMLGIGISIFCDNISSSIDILLVIL